MVNLCNFVAIDGLKPVLLMIVVQVIHALVGIMLKMVTHDGKSLSVLVAYRFMFSAAFNVPVAFIFERNTLQKVTGLALFQAFLCGLFGGSLQQNLYVESLALIPATYTITMLNLIPVVTYVLAVSLRLEKPNLGTRAGKAKLLGTLTGVGGAMILTLYEGSRIFKWSLNIDLLKNVAHSPPSLSAAKGSRLWGIILALGTSLCFSLWYIVQRDCGHLWGFLSKGFSVLSLRNYITTANVVISMSICLEFCDSKMSQKFPWHYSIAALTSVMSAIQATIFALCTERDWNQWKMEWNLRLLTELSGGILASGVCFTLLAYCVRLKGPFFVSAFSPLLLVLVALAGSIVLDEYITIGSVTGAVLIVCGLYMLLWGKSKESQMAVKEVVAKASVVQCDSVQVVNSSLACNQKDHDKNTAASVAAVNASSCPNNSLGEEKSGT